MRSIRAVARSIQRRSFHCTARQQMSSKAATTQHSSATMSSRSPTNWYKPIRLHKVSPQRSVPSGVLRPPYAQPNYTADPRLSQHSGAPIEIKSAAAQNAMRVASAYAAYIRWFAGRQVAIGVTTDAIDERVHNECVRLGVYPSPLLYAQYPKSCCTSINQVVCHGIPDSRALESGDILNIDVSVYVGGYHGDCSGMFTVGQVDDRAQSLIYHVTQALAHATAVCGPGVPISRIGDVCSEWAERGGFSIVQAFCGHGIGSQFHIPPFIHHHRNNDTTLMQPGMTFTIEPMFNEGTHNVAMLSDGWTIVTADGQRSAQVEDTLLITETGVEVLTKYEAETQMPIIPPITNTDKQVST